MQYRFVPLGPFIVPTQNGDVDFSKAAIDKVFEKANEDWQNKGFKPPVGTYFGLYSFCIKTTATVYYHYYVGKAVDQDLRTRTFQTTDKPKKYNDILRECGYLRFDPYIYLMPLVTPSGRRTKKGSNASRIDTAEYLMIGMALRSNSCLWNIKHAASLQAFRIEGIYNSAGILSAAAAQLKDDLGL